MYNETGPSSFLASIYRSNLTLLPMHWLGFAGMPPNSDYPTAFAGWNFVCSYGAYVSVVSLFVFLWLLQKHIL
jgi:cytochrome c oxidase subunit 1